MSTASDPSVAPYASLLVARVERPRGQVKTSWHPLFDGKRVAPGRSTELTLSAHESIRQRLLIVVGGSLSAASPTRALASFRLAVAPGSRVPARFWVDQRGEVGLSVPQPFLAASDSEVDPSVAVAETPTSVSPNSRSRLDLILVLDRIGQEASFERRKTVALQLAEEFQRQFEVPGTLRLGYMAVADAIHVYADRGAARSLPAPVEMVRMGEPAQVVTRLRQLGAAMHLSYDFPGALEQAIRDMQLIPWGSLNHHVALFLTSRPPHPWSVGAHNLLPSAEVAHWPELFADLLRNAPLVPILVTFDSDWPDQTPALQRYVDDAWQHLADHRYHDAPDSPADTQQIVRDVLHALDLDSSLRLPELAA
jgi:hypothetical protein